MSITNSINSVRGNEWLQRGNEWACQAMITGNEWTQRGNEWFTDGNEWTRLA